MFSLNLLNRNLWQYLFAFVFGLGFFQFLQYIHTVHIPREDLRDRVTTQGIILRPINASILATNQFDIYQFESYKIFKCFI